MSDVQAAAPRPLARPRPADPATDLRLAGLHLRMGSLGLARAELEALAGADQLDDDGLVALAEARWRTGDLTGAGDAAQAHLAAAGDSEPALVALVIAAEATAALGRPGEARRLAARAAAGAGTSLDRVFSGMPRSLIWPADPSEAGMPAGTLFADAAPPGPIAAAAPDAADDRAGHPSPSLDEPGFWDGPEAASAAVSVPVDPARALDAGAAALDDGDPAAAAIQLGLAIRLNPALAAPVLDLIRHAAASAAELEMVRGDAYRLVGHEIDARRAWSAAASTAAGAAARRVEKHGSQQETS